MKTFIAVILLYTFCDLTLGQDQIEDMKKIGDACMEANKSNQKDFEDLVAGKLKPADTPESLKCTVKCFMEKNGFLDAATGELKTDEIKRKAKVNDKVNLANLEKAITTCKTLKGDNPCDAAFQFMTCMWEDIKS